MRVNGLFRAFSGALSLILFSSNALFAHAPEANFWEERRKHVQGGEKDLLVAGLPSSSEGILRSLPALARQPPAPSLSQERTDALPPGFAGRNAALLASLPAQYGTLRDIVVPPGPSSGKVVVHIQDVHMNAEAQANIGRAVQALFDGKTVGLLALEGAFQPVDLARYQAFPGRDTMRKVADFWLGENKISGPVHAAMTSAVPAPPVVGVDDPAHYAANVAAYRLSVSRAPEYKARLAAAGKDLAARKAAAFPPALRDFDARVEAYQRGSLPLGEYLKALARRDAPTPALAAFLEVLAAESALDFRRVETERATLVHALTDRLARADMERLLAWSAAYRLGQLRHGDFYRRLQSLCRGSGVDLARTPALDAYIRYVLAADRIDARKLFDEIHASETRAYARLASTPAARLLVEESKEARLTAKLLDFSLSSPEWEDYRSRKPPPLGGADLSSFEDFYVEARARDAALAANLLAAMDSRGVNVAVLVTGGYHSAGVADRLKAAGVASLTFVPKIEKVDAAQGSAYLGVFTRDKTPLERLFQGQKLFLSPDPAGAVHSGAAALSAAALEAWNNPVDGGPSLSERAAAALKEIAPGAEEVSLHARAEGDAVRMDVRWEDKSLSVRMGVEGGKIASFNEAPLPAAGDGLRHVMSLVLDAFSHPLAGDVASPLIDSIPIGEAFPQADTAGSDLARVLDSFERRGIRPRLRVMEGENVRGAAAQAVFAFPSEGRNVLAIVSGRERLVDLLTRPDSPEAVSVLIAQKWAEVFQELSPEETRACGLDPADPLPRRAGEPLDGYIGRLLESARNFIAVKRVALDASPRSARFSLLLGDVPVSVSFAPRGDLLISWNGGRWRVPASVVLHRLAGGSPWSKQIGTAPDDDILRIEGTSLHHAKLSVSLREDAVVVRVKAISLLRGTSLDGHALEEEADAAVLDLPGARQRLKEILTQPPQGGSTVSSLPPQTEPAKSDVRDLRDTSPFWENPAAEEGEDDDEPPPGSGRRPIGGAMGWVQDHFFPAMSDEEYLRGRSARWENGVSLFAGVLIGLAVHLAGGDARQSVLGGHLSAWGVFVLGHAVDLILYLRTLRRGGTPPRNLRTLWLRFAVATAFALFMELSGAGLAFAAPHWLILVPVLDAFSFILHRSLNFSLLRLRAPPDENLSTVAAGSVGHGFGQELFDFRGNWNNVMMAMEFINRRIRAGGASAEVAARMTSITRELASFRPTLDALTAARDKGRKGLPVDAGPFQDDLMTLRNDFMRVRKELWEMEEALFHHDRALHQKNGSLSRRLGNAVLDLDLAVARLESRWEFSTGALLRPRECSVESLAHALEARASWLPQIEDERRRELGLPPGPKVAVDVQFEGRYSDWVPGNYLSLVSALSNILDNAYRHAASRVTIRFVQEKDRVVVRISDDGPGFSAEALSDNPRTRRPRMFDRDFTRAPGGTGQGLAEWPAFLHAGGGVEARNLAGGGAMVEATLPISHSVPSMVPADFAKELEKAQLLIVEDNPKGFGMLARFLLSGRLGATESRLALANILVHLNPTGSESRRKGAKRILKQLLKTPNPHRPDFIEEIERAVLSDKRVHEALGERVSPSDGSWHEDFRKNMLAVLAGAAHDPRLHFLFRESPYYRVTAPVLDEVLEESEPSPASQSESLDERTPLPTTEGPGVLRSRVSLLRWGTLLREQSFLSYAALFSSTAVVGKALLFGAHPASLTLVLAAAFSLLGVALRRKSFLALHVKDQESNLAALRRTGVRVTVPEYRFFVQRGFWFFGVVRAAVFVWSLHGLPGGAEAGALFAALLKAEFFAQSASFLAHVLYDLVSPVPAMSGLGMGAGLELRMENRLLLSQSQSMLGEYGYLEDVLPGLIARAKKAGDVRRFRKFGLDFEYLAVREEDHKSPELDFFWRIMAASGGGRCHFSEVLGRHVLLVDRGVFPAEFVEIVAAHEYGHVVLDNATHTEQNQLEFAVAGKLGLVAPYVDFLLKNHPVKLTDLDDTLALTDAFTPPDVAASRAFFNERRRQARDPSARAAHDLIEGFEFPPQVEQALEATQSSQEAAAGILEGLFDRLRDLARARPEGPSPDWPAYFRALRSEALAGAALLKKDVAVEHLNPASLRSRWLEGVEDVGRLIESALMYYAPRGNEPAVPKDLFPEDVMTLLRPGAAPATLGALRLSGGEPSVGGGEEDDREAPGRPEAPLPHPRPARSERSLPENSSLDYVLGEDGRLVDILTGKTVRAGVKEAVRLTGDYYLITRRGPPDPSAPGFGLYRLGSRDEAVYEDAEGEIVLSPGRRFAFLRAPDGRVESLFDAALGQERSLSTFGWARTYDELKSADDGAVFEDASFTPDGKFIAFIQREGVGPSDWSVRWISLADGQIHRAFPPFPEDAPRSMAVLPGPEYFHESVVWSKGAEDWGVLDLRRAAFKSLAGKDRYERSALFPREDGSRAYALTETLFFNGRHEVQADGGPLLVFSPDGSPRGLLRPLERVHPRFSDLLIDDADPDRPTAVELFTGRRLPFRGTLLHHASTPEGSELVSRAGTTVFIASARGNAPAELAGFPGTSDDKRFWVRESPAGWILSDRAASGKVAETALPAVPKGARPEAYDGAYFAFSDPLRGEVLFQFPFAPGGPKIVAIPVPPEEAPASSAAPADKTAALKSLADKIWPGEESRTSREVVEGKEIATVRGRSHYVIIGDFIFVDAALWEKELLGSPLLAGHTDDVIPCDLGATAWETDPYANFKESGIFTAQAISLLQAHRELFRGTRWLDAGSNDGILGFVMARLGAEVRGIDRKKAAVKESNRRAAFMGLTSFTAVAGELRDAPALFAGERFDGIAANLPQNGHDAVLAEALFYDRNTLDGLRRNWHFRLATEMAHRPRWYLLAGGERGRNPADLGPLPVAALLTGEGWRVASVHSSRSYLTGDSSGHTPIPTSVLLEVSEGAALPPGNLEAEYLASRGDKGAMRSFIRYYLLAHGYLLKDNDWLARVASRYVTARKKPPFAKFSGEFRAERLAVLAEQNLLKEIAPRLSALPPVPAALHVARAEALLKRLGVGAGSRVVSIGPGFPVPSRMTADLIPWEWLCVRAGAHVAVYEPAPQANVAWRERMDLWSAGDRMDVPPIEASHFESVRVPEGAVDVAVLMSVISHPDLYSNGDSVKILSRALQGLKDGGHLVVGWYLDWPGDMDRARSNEILEALESRGYRFIREEDGSEPGVLPAAHGWTAYRVVKPPKTSAAAFPPLVRVLEKVLLWKAALRGPAAGRPAARLAKVRSDVIEKYAPLVESGLWGAAYLFSTFFLGSRYDSVFLSPAFLYTAFTLAFAWSHTSVYRWEGLSWTAKKLSWTRWEGGWKTRLSLTAGAALIHLPFLFETALGTVMGSLAGWPLVVASATMTALSVAAHMLHNDAARLGLWAPLAGGAAPAAPSLTDVLSAARDGDPAATEKAVLSLLGPAMKLDVQSVDPAALKAWAARTGGLDPAFLSSADRRFVCLPRDFIDGRTDDVLRRLVDDVSAGRNEDRPVVLVSDDDAAVRRLASLAAGRPGAVAAKAAHLVDQGKIRHAALNGALRPGESCEVVAPDGYPSELAGADPRLTGPGVRKSLESLLRVIEFMDRLRRYIDQFA